MFTDSPTIFSAYISRYRWNILLPVWYIIITQQLCPQTGSNKGHSVARQHSPLTEAFVPIPLLCLFAYLVVVKRPKGSSLVYLTTWTSPWVQKGYKKSDMHQSLQLCARWNGAIIAIICPCMVPTPVWLCWQNAVHLYHTVSSAVQCIITTHGACTHTLVHWITRAAVPTIWQVTPLVSLSTENLMGRSVLCLKWSECPCHPHASKWKEHSHLHHNKNRP